ncbi:hypothetical protein HYU50_05495 [Candidatus Woesearchaeota archaeon]|nr:hypothetical protein [Candidatus Woesearchaeota archaeon]
MYKRHNIWDEDKWDIHGSGSYAGHGDGKSKEPEHYHKSAMYGSSKNDADKLKDDYRPANNAEEDKDKEKEKDSIADRIAEEEKKEEKQQQEEEEGFFKSIKSEFRPEHMQQEENKKKNKKHHSSIEEAINKAIKEEKKTIFID